MDDEKLKLINAKQGEISQITEIVRYLESLTIPDSVFVLKIRGRSKDVELTEYEQSLFKTIVLTDRKMQLEELEKEFAEM